MDKIKQKKLPEMICFSLFIVCTVFLCVFHEPWVDEFQSWQISKDSLYNIIFILPHYEGHPPLWWLILKCFSSLNINPELGIAIPNLLFMYSAVWLLIFKSPIPLKFKLLLPFTYFLFYQYTIISRPYSIFCFALFLSALFFKERNEHPFKMIIPLSVLALSCAFGMCIAVGIIVVMFIELIKQRDFSLSSLIKTNQFKAVFSMLLICLFILLMIFPSPEHITFEQRFSGLLSVKILYLLFILPCDSLFTNYCVSVPDLSKIDIMYCCLGTGIYVLLYNVLKSHKALLLFFIPYLLCLICSFNYIEVHHIGLFTVFYIFIWWCISDKNNTKTKHKFDKLTYIFIIFTIIIQIYWSVSASINEYKFDYWYGRSIANYIKKYNLDKYNIMSEWLVNLYLKTGNNLEANINNENGKGNVIFFQLNPAALSVNTYFYSNIFKNFNIIYPDKNYLVLKKMNEKETELTKEKMIEYGLPEIFIGNLYILPVVYKNKADKNIYYDRVKAVYYNKIFKSRSQKKIMPIFVRNDINENLYLPLE